MTAPGNTRENGFLNMQRIVLVRHAEPEIEIDKPAAEWALTERGMESSRRLAGELGDLACTVVIASPERKAIQTGQILADALGLPLEQDPRFAEQGAEPGEFYHDYAEFRTRVRQHFAVPEEVILRGESSRAAGARFGAAIASLQGSASDDAVPVIVSHGRIMASWLASLTGTSAWEIWTGLRMPDLIDVDLEQSSFRSIPIPLY
jgi:probable phosphoglycerate mutase